MSVTRTLQIGDRPAKLAQAVAELGRIDKTIHVLTYINDESKWRRTLNQLNGGEERYKLGRAMFMESARNYGHSADPKMHWRKWLSSA